MSIRSERKAAIAEANGNRKWCPECRQWILCRRGRLKLNNHIKSEHEWAWKKYYAPTIEEAQDWEVPLA